MQTKVAAVTGQSLAEAAELIRRGEIVGFPTETVYGLGADAMNADAVRKIFQAKGRPGDNPLIVHVCREEQLRELSARWDSAAQALCEAFMPGPITVVVPRAPQIPDAVTAGLDSVGLRFSAHPAAIDMIRLSGTAVAAPSANRSGSPSPTAAAHVLADLDGRVPLILDGGACAVGVESTVISLVGKTPLLLRPGGITAEQLREVLGPIEIHPSVLHAGKVDRAASPGMKYKHYSPRARVAILDRSCGKRAIRAALAAARAAGLRAGLVCAAGDAPAAERPFASYGTAAQAAAELFGTLRRADEEGLDLLLFRALPLSGIGLSVMNRLLRAAAFTVLRPGAALTVEKDGAACTVAVPV